MTDFRVLFIYGFQNFFYIVHLFYSELKKTGSGVANPSPKQNWGLIRGKKKILVEESHVTGSKIKTINTGLV